MQTAGTNDVTHQENIDLNSLLSRCFPEETLIAAQVADEARVANKKRGMGAGRGQTECEGEDPWL